MNIEEQAEAIVMKKAEEVAYSNMKSFSGRLTESDTLELIKGYIIYGARLYQETLTILNNETQKNTH